MFLCLLIGLNNGEIVLLLRVNNVLQIIPFIPTGNKDIFVYTKVSKQIPHNSLVNTFLAAE